jgi:hypothetical protein
MIITAIPIGNRRESAAEVWPDGSRTGLTRPDVAGEQGDGQGAAASNQDIPCFMDIKQAHHVPLVAEAFFLM